MYWLEAQGHEVQYPKDIMVAPAPKEENPEGIFVAPIAKEVRVVEEAVESSPKRIPLVTRPSVKILIRKARKVEGLSIRRFPQVLVRKSGLSTNLLISPL